MNSAAARWDAAMAALQAGQTAEAEAAMRALVAAGQASAAHAELLAKVIYNRAAAILQGDRLDGLDVAEQLVREAMGFAPDWADAKRGLVKLLYRRSGVHEAAGAWSDAAIAAWEIAALSPDPLTGFADQAQRLEAQARAMTAMDVVTAARLALAAWGLAGQGTTHYATARSLFVHLGTGEHGPAVDPAVFEALLQNDPKDLVAMIGLANLHRRARRLHTAEQLYRTALSHWPENPFATARLASLLAEQGALESADALFQAVGRRFGGVEATIRLSPAFLRGLTSPRIEDPELAVPAGAAYVVLVGGDAGYFHRFGDALANSLARNAPGCALHFQIVAPDADVVPRLQAMRARHPHLPIAGAAGAVPDSVPESLRTTYYACARFLHLPSLLAAYAKPILLLDIDMVVLRDPAPLLDRLRHEQADLALVHGETRDPWCTLWADTVLVAPSPRAMDFASLVRNYIAHFIGRGEAAWFLDQVALFAAAAAGFGDRPAPLMLSLPTDIQNTRTDLAYFWSLHMSQPTNATGPETELYRRFRENAL